MRPSPQGWQFVVLIGDGLAAASPPVRALGSTALGVIKGTRTPLLTVLVMLGTCQFPSGAGTECGSGVAGRMGVKFTK